MRDCIGMVSVCLPRVGQRGPLLHYGRGLDGGAPEPGRVLGRVLGGVVLGGVVLGVVLGGVVAGAMAPGAGVVAVLFGGAIIVAVVSAVVAVVAAGVRRMNRNHRINARIMMPMSHGHMPGPSFRWIGMSAIVVVRWSRDVVAYVVYP